MLRGRESQSQTFFEIECTSGRSTKEERLEALDLRCLRVPLHEPKQEVTEDDYQGDGTQTNGESGEYELFTGSRSVGNRCSSRLLRQQSVVDVRTRQGDGIDRGDLSQRRYGD